MKSFEQNHGNQINHKNHSPDNFTFFGVVRRTRFDYVIVRFFSHIYTGNRMYSQPLLVFFTNE